METRQITLKTLYKAIQSLQQEVHEIKETIVEDEGELTEEAHQLLQESRETPLTEYKDNEEVLKEFSIDKE
jgi:hypothetical protein